jgi:hypothetical protein
MEPAEDVLLSPVAMATEPVAEEEDDPEEIDTGPLDSGAVAI